MTERTYNGIVCWTCGALVVASGILAPTAARAQTPQFITGGNPSCSETLTDTGTLRLSNREPTGTVTVTLTVEDQTVATVSPTSMTFEPATWTNDQAYTVTCGDDDIYNSAGSRTTKLTFAATGAEYEGLTKQQTIHVLDDDPIPLTRDEGATIRYGYAALVSEGAGTVTITATSSDPDIVSVAPESYSWTETTSQDAMYWTLTVVDDDVYRPDATATVSFSWTPNYHFKVQSAIVTVRDNDEPPAINRPPTVSASCAPCEVSVGGEVHLTATASDPDGDTLTYEWSAATGRFEGTTDGSTARWQAPGETGAVPIRIRVSDGSGSASAVVAVEVINRAPTFEHPVYRFGLPENRNGRRQPVDLGRVTAEDPDGTR